MPFPIQRFQTDRGAEFFAKKVQEKMMELGIKFPPNKPASPHLNGKVERSQKPDESAFYAAVVITCYDLDEQLAEWQHYYNWNRPHSVYSGITPMEKSISKYQLILLIQTKSIKTMIRQISAFKTVITSEI